VYHQHLGLHLRCPQGRCGWHSFSTHSVHIELCVFYHSHHTSSAKWQSSVFFMRSSCLPSNAALNVDQHNVNADCSAKMSEFTEVGKAVKFLHPVLLSVSNHILMHNTCHLDLKKLSPRTEMYSTSWSFKHLRLLAFQAAILCFWFLGMPSVICLFLS